MKYAIIENGVVANVVLADAEFAAEQGWVPCEQAGPGWKYDGATFTEPDPVPATETTLTKDQLLVQLQALQAQIQALE